MPPDQPWKFITTAGEPFSLDFQFSRKKRKVRLHANQTYLRVDIIGDFSIEPLGINRDDRTWPMFDTGSHTIGNKEYRVFARRDKLSSTQIAFLKKPELVNLVEKTGLSGGEMIHANGSGLSLYLIRPDRERLMQAIDHSISLAAQMKTDPREQKNFQKLPSQFHSIIPLLEKWSVSDDSDREDLLAGFPKATLKRLVEEVSPYFESINSYLDSFGKQPLPEEAAALGRLAESATEAKRLLEK